MNHQLDGHGGMRTLLPLLLGSGAAAHHNCQRLISPNNSASPGRSGAGGGIARGAGEAQICGCPRLTEGAVQLVPHPQACGQEGKVGAS